MVYEKSAGPEVSDWWELATLRNVNDCTKHIGESFEGVSSEVLLIRITPNRGILFADVAL